MKHLCPECLGALVIDEEGAARCQVHGGGFRVLFQRTVEPPPIAASPGSASPGTGEPAGAAPAATPIPGVFCVQHPTVPATKQCQRCGAYVCPTCDFVFPGDIHLCPACATDPQPALSPRRRNFRAWSFGLAGGATLFLALLVSGAFRGMVKTKEEVAALGLLLFLTILIPAIIGLSIGLGAIDRRLVNPLSLRLAVIWNALIVGAFVLLSIIGQMKH